ncbi:MAG: hypothetical protein JSW45_11505 [Thiotrichales bacterium]|nr:MAG: hypothetical protein JSW45_11505 [Thiotrichales bacterium]
MLAVAVNVAIDVHTLVNGKQYVVMPADEFDSAVRCNKLLSCVGSRACDVILELNRSCNYLRCKLGLPCWALSSYIKHRVNHAVTYINRFEDVGERPSIASQTVLITDALPDDNTMAGSTSRSGRMAPSWYPMIRLTQFIALITDNLLRQSMINRVYTLRESD